MGAFDVGHGRALFVDGVHEVGTEGGDVVAVAFGFLELVVAEPRSEPQPYFASSTTFPLNTGEVFVSGN